MSNESPAGSVQKGQTLFLGAYKLDYLLYIKSKKVKLRAFWIKFSLFCGFVPACAALGLSEKDSPIRHSLELNKSRELSI